MRSRIDGIEALAVAMFMAVIGWLHYLIISKFHCLFADYSDKNWHVFENNYHMSGFDPYIYVITTDWCYQYDVIRHPLLAFMLWPLYAINQGLWWLTGMNCCQYVVGALLYGCAICAYILLFRLIRDVIGLSGWVAMLLSLMFAAFAYVMVAMIVPDHFCLSLCCIMFVIYKAAKKLVGGELFSKKETILLFVITAGITLSNAVILFIAVLVVNGRKFFEKRFFCEAVVLPSLLMLSVAVGINVCRFSIHSTEVLPVESQMDNVYEEPRIDVLMENFFGESLQLHREHILGDVLVRRPVIVRYTWPMQYVVEGVLVLLMAAGAWLSRKERITWMLLLVLAFNISLHIVLGFAINEVYIMACHWAFVIPLLIAYLLKAARPHRVCNAALLSVIVCITVYLYAYHGTLLYNYLTWPLTGITNL